MRRMLAGYVVMASLGAVLAACSPAGRSTAGTAPGRQLYLEQCAVCHGADGAGDGPAAYLLFPRPRDFTRAYYKIRSTATGSLPTDDDLYQTITRGMPGSAMPSFEWLSDGDRRALVQAVQSFSEDFASLQPEPLAAPPAPPAADARTLTLGAAAYRGLGCGKCHGDRGRGDGPSAATLRDDWGYPIRPNDFTRGIYKGGGTDRDIYRRFAGGMDGTPMPSYEGTATPNQIWALVRYVKSLAGETVAVQPSKGRLLARRVAAPLPLEPADPRWREVEEFRVPLMLLWQRQHAAAAVGVRALHDGETLALLISWDDPTPAWSVLRNQEFADAVAVQFPLATSTAHFSMGSAAGRVNIWHWRADRQLDVAARRGLESVYPLSVSDAFEGGPNFVAAADAGNLAAAPRLLSAVQDLTAEGFGTLTAQPPAGQNVLGSGVWDSGQWHVLLHRTLRSGERSDVSLVVGAVVPIAFAVWDGDRDDRDGQKGVTTWYELEIEP